MNKVVLTRRCVVVKKTVLERSTVLFFRTRTVHLIFSLFTLSNMVTQRILHSHFVSIALRFLVYTSMLFKFLLLTSSWTQNLFHTSRCLFLQRFSIHNTVRFNHYTKAFYVLITVVTRGSLACSFISEDHFYPCRNNCTLSRLSHITLPTAASPHCIQVLHTWVPRKTPPASFQSVSANNEIIIVH